MYRYSVTFSQTFLVVAIALGLTGCSSSESSSSGEENFNPGNVLLSDGSEPTGSNGSQDNNGQNPLATPSPGSSSNPLPSPTPSNNENSSAKLISDANVDELLMQAIKALNLTRLSQVREFAVKRGSELAAIGRSVVDGEDIPAHLTVASFAATKVATKNNLNFDITYNCSNGGRIEQHLRLIEGPFSRIRVLFENCAWPIADNNNATEILDGRVVYSSGRRSDTVTTLENFTRSSGEASATASGVHTNFYSHFSASVSSEWANAAVTVQDAAGTKTLSPFSWKSEALHSPEVPAQYIYTYDLSGNLQRLVFVNHKANITASFSLNSAATGNSPVAVSTNIALDSPYYDWAPMPGITAPDYPVSDLGPTFTYAFSPEYESATLFTAVSLPAPSQAQWQTGGVLLTATDGSNAKLTPHADNTSQVLVEINGSGTPTTRVVADGYQIALPEVLIGVGQ